MNETSSNHSTPSYNWFNSNPLNHNAEPTTTPNASATNPNTNTTTTTITTLATNDQIKVHTNREEEGEGETILPPAQLSTAQVQVQIPPVTHDELKQWSEFTNLDDFSALEEHLSFLNKENKNTSQQHHNAMSELGTDDQNELNINYTDFSHTAFPPPAFNNNNNNNTHSSHHHHEDGDFNIDDESSSSLAMRPDLIFTPLVSPAVTPMDKNLQQQQQQQAARMFQQNENNIFEYDVTGTSSSSNVNGNGMFSPLTSPALEFQQVKSSPIMRIKKSHIDESAGGSANSSTSSIHHKRHTSAGGSGNGSTTMMVSNSTNKTPGSTPIMGGPNIPGRVTKQSPVIKSRRHSSLAKSFNGNSGDIKLPESSMDFKAPNGIPKRTNSTSSSNNNNRRHSRNGTGNGLPFTPATLMNFKISDQKQFEHSHDNELQQQQQQQNQDQHQNGDHHFERDEYNNSPGKQQQQQQQQQVVLNTNREHSNSSSPVILPSSSSTTTTPIMGPRRSNSLNNNKKKLKSTKSTTTTTSMDSNNTREDEVVPAAAAGAAALSQATQASPELQSDKKINHKLAEQGRRNRMNQAIANLDVLIPNDWKKNVLVPSKATTVEIAIEYLKYLQQSNSNNNNNTNNTSDSISPFD